MAWQPARAFAKGDALYTSGAAHPSFLQITEFFCLPVPLGAFSAPAKYLKKEKMEMRKPLMFTILLFTVLLFTACPFNSFAINDHIFPGGIGPSSDKIVVSPGETKTARISFIVLSKGQQTINFIPVNVAFGSLGDMLFPQKPGNPGASLIRKINPMQAQGRGTIESVEITVTVPDGTTPGDYPVAILAKELNLCSILLVRVPHVPQKGKINFQGKIKNAKIETDRVARLVLSVEYENLANFTYMPGVRCAITKKGGKEPVLDIDMEMLNPMYRFILPGNSRLFTAAIQQPLDIGEYEADFYSLIVSGEGKVIATQHLIKEMKVDKDLFRKQQATFFIKVPVTVHPYRIPPNFLFNNGIQVVNLFDQKVTVYAMSSESWLKVSSAAVKGISIEPGQSGLVLFSIETPAAFDDVLKSNIVLTPYVGMTPAGIPMAVTISVIPGSAK